MTISPKPGLDASTDQAFAEARECRRTLSAAQVLVPYSDQIAQILKTQFPGAGPEAWRVLMSAVQSAAAMHLVLEAGDVKPTGTLLLNALALAAEQLARESGGLSLPAPDGADAIAREVTRLRGLGAGGYDKVLSAFELLLRFHTPCATQEEYAAILAALTGQVQKGA